MGNRIINPSTVDDYKLIAEKKLPRFVYDYIDGGSGDESTVTLNESDFHRVLLKARVLRNVDNLDTSIKLLGEDISMPVILAPVGMAGMVACRGEVQAARAAKNCAVPFCDSTVSVCSLEEIVASSGAAVWFQLYMLRDREIIFDLLAKAAQLGCRKLIMTVDLPVVGYRHREFQNGMLAGGTRGKLYKLWQVLKHPSWLARVMIKGKPIDLGNIRQYVNDSTDMDKIKEFVDSQFDPTVTWDEVRMIRERWDGELILKGVMSVEDAKLAMDVGADAIVVSNHGGRQLSGGCSTIKVLPAISQVINGKIPIILDSGVRSGVDVIRALALGASAVMIGRSWVWALAAREQQGVEKLLLTFQREIAVNMALLGVNSCKDIDRKVIDSLDW